MPPRRLKTPVGRHPGQRLVVLVGLPACGKSTWARQHVVDGVAVEALEPFADDAAPDLGVAIAEHRRAVTEHIDEGRTVVVDGCNIALRTRRYWLELAQLRGVAPCVVVFDTDWSVCAARNRARGVPVPEEAMVRYQHRWRPARDATRAEGWAERLWIGR